MMTIFTRHGSPVDIEAVDFQADIGTVTVRYQDGRGTAETYLHDLRADNGLQEIMQDIWRKFPEHDPHSEHYEDR